MGVLSKVTKKWIWRIVVIATALLIISPLIICIAIKKRNIMLEEKKRKRTETEMLDLAVSNESLGIKDLEEDLKLFSYTSVVVAANDFSLENKLGEGGFGPVYKGTLPTGEEVAIKRLSKGSGKGIVEFRNELTLICELQHMNLVQLIGCCIHEEERILMYEYMLTKSLDFYIFGKEYAKVYLIICSMQAHTQGFNIIEGKSFMLGNVA
ncbi:hypothetical protein GLYMA_11G156900v4 [Glycine max]|nr:hypothetical protein GLYMA_11G156900v4 [Glycine max]KAH1159631.1 hypothetical protein GYH30_031371 [Glycine max]